MRIAAIIAVCLSAGPVLGQDTSPIPESESESKPDVSERISSSTFSSVMRGRSIGPALMSGSWDNHWIFWIGPIVGGAIAALVYKYVFMSDGDGEQSDAGGAT